MAQAIERLGETEAAPGYLLLQLLSHQGWRISVVRAPDDSGDVLVAASKLGFRSVERQGESVASVAVDVVAGCTAAQRYACARELDS